MSQPIPKKVKETHPNADRKMTTTLLVDGSNILQLSMADDTFSSNGTNIGGVFQFLLQLRMMISKGNFDNVYVMWDCENTAGSLRYALYSDYKSNRDKNFDEANLSPYMREVNARIHRMENYFYKQKDPQKLSDDKKRKELFYWQRDIIMECLEELCIRQCMCEDTEADDLIAYYVNHMRPDNRCVIMSCDMDLSQLVSERVIVYNQRLKKFINTKNFKEEFGYHYENVALQKIICGDASDAIKGIKGVGTKTLFDNFPEFKERKVELEEVVEKARQINEARAKEKKKPLKWAENIVNRVTDGVQGDMIYEINRKIIDLRNPLMTDDAKELMDSIMYAPLDVTDRTMENLYKIVIKNDIDSLKDSNRFSNFFSPFVTIYDKEVKFANNSNEKQA